MDRHAWELEELTRRVAAVDPGGPVPETSLALRRLHRELVSAVGPEQARWRFDEALRRALSRPGAGSGLPEPLAV